MEEYTTSRIQPLNERDLVRWLDAQVDMIFPPDELRCHIVIPGRHLVVSR